MQVRNSAALLAALVLLISLLVAVGGGAASSAAETGAITGTVTNSETDQPIAGAYVKVWRAKNTDAPWLDEYVGQLGWSDDLGNFVVDGLAPDTYGLCVGLADPAYDKACAGQRRDGYDAVVTVQAGGESVADVQIEPAGSISGTVLDDLTGAPITDARVYVSVWDELDESWTIVADRHPAGVVRNGRLVREDGTYRVPSLAPDTYRVCVGSDRHVDECFDAASDVRTADDVVVAPANDSGGVGFRLVPYGRISGTVTDAWTSDPAAGAVYSIYEWSQAYGTWIESDRDVTDDAGRYIADVAPGVHRVCFGRGRERLYERYCHAGAAAVGEATDVEVTPGGEAVVNADIVPRPKVTGRVIDERTGEPVRSMGVWAYRWRDEEGEWSWTETANTDSAGRFAFIGLTPDRYRFCFTNETSILPYEFECYDSANDVGAATDVVLPTDSDVSGVDVALAQEGVIYPIARPTIEGTPEIGATLSVDTGVWHPGDAQIDAQWMLGGEPIEGATGLSLRIAPDHQGQLVTVQLTVSHAGHDTVSEVTPAVGPVVEPPPVLCRGRVATIVGTDGPDELVGTPGPDVIHGLGGDDVIRGAGGDDIICGGGGADIIRAGRGADVVAAGGGADEVWGGGGQDILLGGRHADKLVGGRSADRLKGGAGPDVLVGGARRDVLVGGRGRDVLRGGAGADALNGASGRDRCNGGSGRDRARKCEVLRRIP